MELILKCISKGAHLINWKVISNYHKKMYCKHRRISLIRIRMNIFINLKYILIIHLWLRIKKKKLKIMKMIFQIFIRKEAKVNFNNIIWINKKICRSWINKLKRNFLKINLFRIKLMEISKLIKLFRVNLKLFILLILKNRKKRNSKILRKLLIDK